MSDNFEQKHMEALNALRAGVSKEMEEKINSFLDVQETKNQAKFKDIQEKANKAEELENRLNSIEADLKRGIGGGEKQAKSQELKSFENLLIKGTLKMNGSEELKYLRQDDNVNGGYLAPAEYANEIIKKITEVSPVRSVARVISTSKKEIQFPKRTGLVSGGWVGEGQDSSQSNSAYGEETLKAEKLMVYTDISFELLNDSAFNMRSEITSDIAEDMAKLEGSAFVSGNGVNKPFGLLSASGVGETNSGSASALTGDSLYTIQGEIPTGYNLAWMLNRKTLNAHIRTLKDTYGQYLFVPSLGTRDVPNTVAGLPYVWLMICQMYLLEHFQSFLVIIVNVITLLIMWTLN